MGFFSDIKCAVKVNKYPFHENRAESYLLFSSSFLGCFLPGADVCFLSFMIFLLLEKEENQEHLLAFNTDFKEPEKTEPVFNTHL